MNTSMTLNQHAFVSILEEFASLGRKVSMLLASEAMVPVTPRPIVKRGRPAKVLPTSQYRFAYEVIANAISNIHARTKRPVTFPEIYDELEAGANSGRSNRIKKVTVRNTLTQKEGTFWKRCGHGFYLPL